MQSIEVAKALSDSTPRQQAIPPGKDTHKDCLVVDINQVANTALCYTNRGHRWSFTQHDFSGASASLRAVVVEGLEVRQSAADG